MNNEQYHADTSAISASGLKLFARSPAHYYAAYLDPQRPERQPGSYTHPTLPTILLMLLSVVAVT